jgi:hypothetical protein
MAVPPLVPDLAHFLCVRDRGRMRFLRSGSAGGSGLGDNLTAAVSRDCRFARGVALGVWFARGGALKVWWGGDHCLFVRGGSYRCVTWLTCRRGCFGLGLVCTVRLSRAGTTSGQVPSALCLKLALTVQRQACNMHGLIIHKAIKDTHLVPGLEMCGYYGHGLRKPRTTHVGLHTWLSSGCQLFSSGGRRAKPWPQGKQEH